MSDWLQGDNAPGEDDAAPGEGGAPSGPNDPLNAPGFVQRAVSGIAQQFTTPGAAMQPNPYPAGSEEAAWYDQNRQDTINNWAPGMALNMAGAGSAFAEPGAVGAAGGKLGAGSGLDMSTSARMQRAAEQGYTIDAYKGGQFNDWNTLPEYNGRGEVIKGTENRVPQELTEMRSSLGNGTPHAGFYSSNPEVSNRFAAPFEYGSVMPAKLKMENPMIIDAKGEHAAAFQFESIARQRGTVDQMNKFHEGLHPDSPHDGVILKNTKDEGDVYVPKNSDQVRSRFAKFDPANVKSGDLLGGVAAATAGGAAFLRGTNEAKASTTDVQSQYKSLGATPGEMQLLHIESGFQNDQVTGRNAGHAQFSPDLQKKYGITDPDNPEQVLHAVRAERADFEKATGRPLSDGEFYLMHQQGQYGGKALLNADPSASAWQTVRQFYGSDAVAKKAIWGNIPDSAKKQFGSVDNVSAGQFAQLWKSRFDGGQAPTQTASATPAAGTQEPAKPQTVGDRMKAWLRNQATPSNDQPQQAPEKDDEPQQQAAIIPTPDPVSSVIRQGGKVYFRRYGRVYDDKGNAVG